ncbi:protein-glutamate methylesterase/protein-glutamine glutaminase [Alteromonas facilis]|uniref:protein-glutamate methylesterase/protein-glutamine glutaminase n=1 Tax=Alteromonas facilis TaxID=2048004 RepID=UPI000C2853D6|nr:chemotaxis response regulator protein-glutamate methylesterase [Alteromonas facilis]
MSLKVLVVDDSSFYRRRVREILNQDPALEVVAEASNGEIALAKIQEFSPDVVTMDVEMPVMDGITAVRKIMATSPVPILMFSSITQDGAEATIQALEAGALDFLPKNFEDIARDRREATMVLRSKVRAIASRPMRARRPLSTPLTTPGKTAATQKFFKSSSVISGPSSTTPTPAQPSYRYKSKAYKLLAIGSSTGGPVALQKVLQPLPASFSLPILLVQHMPGTFTTAFAQRLNSICNITVKEAEHGDILRPGHAYLAPGGKQMLVEGTANSPRLKIVDSVPGEDLTYKPSVDLTFKSCGKVFGGDILGLVLTGMGADGKLGSQDIKRLGATIWAQDEATCVVYGMPQAVTTANISERSLPIERFATEVMAEVKG